jgi:hypothetical protein
MERGSSRRPLSDTDDDVEWDDDDDEVIRRSWSHLQSLEPLSGGHQCCCLWGGCLNN